MIIAIDFDGTIVENNFPRIGRLKPNAKEVISKLKAEGHYIIIWTCRKQQRETEARNFLIQNNIPFDLVNESNAVNVQKYGGVDTRKVYADVYIDDNGLVELHDWNDIYEMIYKKIMR